MSFEIVIFFLISLKNIQYCFLCNCFMYEKNWKIVKNTIRWKNKKTFRFIYRLPAFCVYHLSSLLCWQCAVEEKIFEHTCTFLWPYTRGKILVNPDERKTANGIITHIKYEFISKYSNIHKFLALK